MDSTLLSGLIQGAIDQIVARIKIRARNHHIGGLPMNQRLARHPARHIHGHFRYWKPPWVESLFFDSPCHFPSVFEVPRPRHRPDVHSLALATQGNDFIDECAGADGLASTTQ